MKRVVICVFLLAAVVSTSFYTYYKAATVKKEVDARIDELMPVLESGDSEEIIARVTEFTAYWEEEENSLIHFVRHSHIENITTSAARLPVLAAYGEVSEIGAELANIRRQMEHIHDSERITLDNWL